MGRHSRVFLVVSSLVLLAAALIIALFAAPGGSRAAGPIEFADSVTLVESSPPGDIGLANDTFDNAVAALQAAEAAGGPVSLAVGVPGLANVVMAGPVKVGNDPTAFTVTVNHSAQMDFGASTGVAVNVELIADWTDANTDTAPVITLSLTLKSGVSLQDLLSPLGRAASLQGLDVSNEVLKTLGAFESDVDVTVSVEVDPAVGVSYSAQGGAAFGVGPGAGGCPSPVEPALCLNVTALLSVAADGQVLFAVKPQIGVSPLTLSDLLGPILPVGVDIPSIIDPEVFGPSKPLAFVFSAEFFNMQDLTDAQESFFEDFKIAGAFPYLIIGDPVNDVGGFAVFGKFPLPGANEPPLDHDTGSLAELVSEIGLSPNVLMTAGMPMLTPGSFSLSLAMGANQDSLPSWVLASETGVSLNLNVTTTPSPSLSLGLTGTLGIKFRSGLPPDVANQLSTLGIPVYSAVSYSSKATAQANCPEGSEAMQDDPNVANSWWCYDRLKGTITASMGFVTAPPSFTIALDAGLKNLNTELSDPNDPSSALVPAPWYPFGLQFLGVAEARFHLGVTSDVTGVGVEIGIMGDMTIKLGSSFETDALFAIQLQVTPVAACPPCVTVTLDGFRVASGQGMELQEVIQLINEAADPLNSSSSPLLPVDALPNLAMHNLELSFAPSLQGVPGLCIPGGFVIAGDFYIDDTGAFTSNPSCLNSVSSPGTGDSCGDRDGCFFSGYLELKPTGLVADASLGDLVIGPLYLTNNELHVRLTAADQYFKVTGNVAVDLTDPENCSPQTSPCLFAGTVDLFIGNPFSGEAFRLLGQVSVLDAFNASISATAGGWMNPKFEATVRMDNSFNAQTAQDTRPLMEIIRTAVRILDGIWTGLGDPNQAIDALLGLPADFANLSASAPDWLITLTESIENIRNSDATNKPVGANLLHYILNGVPIEPLRFEGSPAGGWAKQDFCSNPLRTASWCWWTKPRDPVRSYVWDFWNGWHWVTIIPGSSGTPATVTNRCRLVQQEYEGRCYVPGLIPRDIDLSIPGVCTFLFPGRDLSQDPCTLADLRDLLATPLELAVRQLTGLDNFTISGMLDDLATRLESGGPLLALSCAEFNVRFDPFPTQASMAMTFWVLGTQVDFGLKWMLNPNDINGTPLDTVRAIIDALLSPVPVVCQGSSNPSPSGEAPVMNPLSPVKIDENGVANIKGSFTTTTQDPHTVRVIWDDGAVGELQLAAGVTSFQLTHQYLDDDPLGSSSDDYNVVVSVEHPTAGSDSETVVVTVNNVAPSVTASLDYAKIVENGSVALTGSVTDVGTQDTHTAVVDWGDGSSEPVTVSGGAFSATHQYLDDDPTATPQDNYSVVVTVTDDDGGSDSAVLKVTVNNSPPELTTLTASPPIDEGGAAVIAGAFTDVGTLDIHTVDISWGDGTSDTFDLSQGARTFAAVHVYLDDDPTVTPQDDYGINVTITDDDGGQASDGVTQTVINVAPQLHLGSETVGEDHPFEAYENETVLLRGYINDPGVLDTHTVHVEWGDGATSDVVVAAGIDEFVAEHVYLDDNPATGTPSDDLTIVAIVEDDDSGVSAPGVTTTILADESVIVAEPVITVNDVAPDVDADPGWQSVQYSDPIVPVLVTATDVETDPLVATTTWAAGSVAGSGDLANAGLPDWLALSGDGNCVTDHPANLRTCTWTLSPQLSGAGVHSDADPGTYTVRVKITDDDTLFTEQDIVIKILPEDAKAYYVGPTFAASELARGGSFRPEIKLRANVRDVTTAVEGPGAPWDPYPGDVRNATVTFVDMSKSPGESGYQLCSAPVDTILRDGDKPDTNIGTAVCVWQPEIGIEDAMAFKISVVVGGRYTNSLFPEQDTVTVAKPISKFITGGGCLALEASEGAYAGSDGSHTNFGFNVKFRRHGTDLRGRATVLFRVDGRTYKISPTSFVSIGVVDPTGDPPRTAQFEALARLYDVTDDDYPILLGRDLSFQMMMTDVSEPNEHNDDGDFDENCPFGDDHVEVGSSPYVADSISFTLWEGSEGRQQRLLFSSAWDGNRTVAQLLEGGNLNVHRERARRR